MRASDVCGYTGVDLRRSFLNRLTYSKTPSIVFHIKSFIHLCRCRVGFLVHVAVDGVSVEQGSAGRNADGLPAARRAGTFSSVLLVESVERK